MFRALWVEAFIPVPKEPEPFADLRALTRALGRHGNAVQVTALEETVSTNSLAKTEAHLDTPSLYLARTQTGGRGRLGRSFHSPADTGLYMTVAYTTRRPLTEAVTRPDGAHRIVVGLGINLTTTEFPEGLRAPATALFSPDNAKAATPALTGALAGAITRRLLDLVDPASGDDFPLGMWGDKCLEEYRRRLLYVGTRVICTRGDTRFEGTVRGVDKDYSLLVETDGGTVTLSSGEISLRPVDMA